MATKEQKAEYQRRWYEKNKAKHVANVAKNKKLHKVELRQKITDYLLSHPCVDCGNQDLRVLEFDHIADNKVNNVSYMFSQGLSWKTIKQEIDKCEVRCKNCHAIKTYERLGNTWHNQYAPVGQLVGPVDS